MLKQDLPLIYLQLLKIIEFIVLYLKEIKIQCLETLINHKILIQMELFFLISVNTMTINKIPIHFLLVHPNITKENNWIRSIEDQSRIIKNLIKITFLLLKLNLNKKIYWLNMTAFCQDKKLIQSLIFI